MEKNFVNKIFNEFLKLNDIKRYSRFTDKGAVICRKI